MAPWLADPPHPVEDRGVLLQVNGRLAGESDGAEGTGRHADGLASWLCPTTAAGVRRP
ncbi:MAG TPA: hypothetical protein VII16_07345 [Actinomycetes bacterium]